MKPYNPNDFGNISEEELRLRAQDLEQLLSLGGITPNQALKLELIREELRKINRVRRYYGY